ncbi:MAG: hypothetical protein A3F18_08070 [Legionellales bacterium RIFCSPHIGHO2_12_FULL_37_14]|nr:MAG: hypothetical protein A3F18_08070 [Legionellales bacterium RIFCSPHIGHO2_12_FULL_37_14]
MNQHEPMKSYQTQLGQYRIKNIKNTIAIASGKGGVGKSTVAVNLAVILAQTGLSVGLLDADIYGPSIPLMLNLKQKASIQAEKYKPLEKYNVQLMSIGFITEFSQALIWRGPMLAKSLIHMLDKTAWPCLDILIIDLPPGTGDIQLSLVQKIPLTAAIVVSTPQAVATIDADKAIQMFHKTNVHVLGLIENMATHTCTACGHEENIFGDKGLATLSKNYNLPLLGKLPLDKNIQTGGELGEPTAIWQNSELANLWHKIALKALEEMQTLPI